MTDAMEETDAVTPSPIAQAPPLLAAEPDLLDLLSGSNDVPESLAEIATAVRENRTSASPEPLLALDERLGEVSSLPACAEAAVIPQLQQQQVSEKGIAAMSDSLLDLGNPPLNPSQPGTSETATAAVQEDLFSPDTTSSSQVVESNVDAVTPGSNTQIGITMADSAGPTAEPEKDTENALLGVLDASEVAAAPLGLLLQPLPDDVTAAAAAAVVQPAEDSFLPKDQLMIPQATELIPHQFEETVDDEDAVEIPHEQPAVVENAGQSPPQPVGAAIEPEPAVETLDEQPPVPVKGVILSPPPPVEEEPAVEPTRSANAPSPVTTEDATRVPPVQATNGRAESTLAIESSSLLPAPASTVDTQQPPFSLAEKHQIGELTNGRKVNDDTSTPTVAQQDKINTLEAELAEAQELVESLLQEKEQQAVSEHQEDDSLLMELQSTLQQQMSLKAEAENKVRLVNDRIQKLEVENEEQATELEKFVDLQSNLQQQMSLKAEAENKARLAEQRVQQLETTNTEQAAELEKTQRELVTMREGQAAREQEVQRIREQRDEQERKEMALTNRLNAAKKKEATKSNLAEQYEEDFQALEQELKDVKHELQELTKTKETIESGYKQSHSSSQERVVNMERTLVEERRLNEERKRKMKAFVENKAEELQQAKADNDSLQSEATQTSRSLVDLNNRFKQLHAQWVQSQTRNRELQRDLNRIKKDSENLHKQGDSLEMKLSRSANETEEHKNKRLAAKHELMTVLRTLEVERDVSNKLRDSIKFTFTPKALSQQQLLKEGVDDLEAQLLKLSRRLGKPLPPSNGGLPLNDLSETSGVGGNAIEEDIMVDQVSGDAKRSEVDMNRLIAKLEFETQHVSQCIMAVTAGIERMHLLLNAGGDRTCYTALSDILSTGTVMTTAAAEETASMTGSGQSSRRLGFIRGSHTYGQVRGASRNLR